MMIRFLSLSVFCCLVFACSSTPPVEEVEPDHGAGTVIRHSPELDAIVPGDYTIEKLDDGFVFIEGPVWVKDPGYLLFSDVRGDTLYQWAPGAKSEPFLKPVYSGPPLENPGAVGPNGLTIDGRGNLVILEHGDRRITRMPLAGGNRETLADRFEGKRFNSPNDLVYHSSGALYFTDPPYGLQGQDESPDKELDFNGVYRLDPDGDLELLTAELNRPNGIAFSPDETTLYVANTDREQRLWMAWDVQPDGSITNGRVFFDASDMEGPGGPDGMKVDSEGNLYCTGPGGVLIFTPEGQHLGTIQPEEQPSNVAWGDADGKTLYMTARTGLYRIRLNIQGLLPVGVR
jgi:gluconolactonase